MTAARGLLLRNPSRSGAEALRVLRTRSRSLSRDLNCLEFDWPTAMEMLEHAAHLLGDALLHDTRCRPPVLGTVIAPPLRNYVADDEDDELTRFVRLLRQLAERSVQHVGGVSITDRNGSTWRLGAGPLMDWYWSTARDRGVLHVCREVLDRRERRLLNEHVLVAITALNRAAFDGHLRSFIPELDHAGECG